tara:strand:- start:250 stop:447 length:198 start_codon:yes stop_codon:yes gene_type:complete
MKNIAKFFLLSFSFYLLGHILWILSVVDEGVFFNADIEFFLISTPFGLFAIFGLIASVRLYNKEK